MSTSNTPRIAIFLDRDGTINQEKGYIRNLADMALLPGAAEAIKRFNDAGMLTILTTNQTGPARKFYGEDHVRALNQRVQELLNSEAGAHLNAVFYCPHLYKPDNSELDPQYAIDCDCRKPKTGMIEMGRQQFPDINLAQSYVIGDKASDVQFGLNAGCKTILLKTGYGQRVLDGKYQSLPQQPTHICDDLLAAAQLICGVNRPSV